MTKIAVTGALGFIGRHVVGELARDPSVTVIAIDRRSPEPGPQRDNVRHVQLELALADSATFVEIGEPDALIHLAWGGLPNYRSLHHLEEELPLQYRFLAHLVRAGLPAVVATGTCFEYGMQSGALDESMTPFPSNPYGYAKDSLRRQLEFLRATSAFRFCWARLFYMHGEGQAPNSLLPQLERAAARGDVAFDMSGGEQLRDYLPVSEIARCLVVMARHGADAGVVNVCSGEPISVRRVVENFIAERGLRIALNLGAYPYPDYEPLAFWGRRERLDAVLARAGESVRRAT